MLFEKGDWRMDLSDDEDGGGDEGGDEFNLTELRKETDALEEDDMPTKVYTNTGK